jgi:hypothetical protein
MSALRERAVIGTTAIPRPRHVRMAAAQALCCCWIRSPLRSRWPRVEFARWEDVVPDRSQEKHESPRSTWNRRLRRGGRNAGRLPVVPDVRRPQRRGSPVRGRQPRNQASAARPTTSFCCGATPSWEARFRSTKQRLIVIAWQQLAVSWHLEPQAEPSRWSFVSSACSPSQDTHRNSREDNQSRKARRRQRRADRPRRQRAPSADGGMSGRLVFRDTRARSATEPPPVTALPRSGPLGPSRWNVRSGLFIAATSPIPREHIAPPATAANVTDVAPASKPAGKLPRSGPETPITCSAALTRLQLASPTLGSWPQRHHENFLTSAVCMRSAEPTDGSWRNSLTSRNIPEEEPAADGSSPDRGASPPMLRPSRMRIHTESRSLQLQVEA